MSKPGSRAWKAASWSDIKRRLRGKGESDLLALIRDLYRLSSENRRFLRTRIIGSGTELENYRQLVEDAIYPDPLGSSTVSIRDAKRAIGQYGLATRDDEGTIELMLTFVEAGTAQAADLGYGDDRYFASLEGMLTKVLKLLTGRQAISADVLRRLGEIEYQSGGIGWGYGDFVRASLLEVLPSEIPEEGVEGMRPNPGC